MKLKIGILRVNLVQKMKLKTINIIDMVAPGKDTRFFIAQKVFHLVFLCSVLCFLGCNKNKDYTQIDDEIIQQYISDNNLNATSTSSGLYYAIETTGNGVFPNIYSTVTVAYTGMLTDGTVFDQSSSAGISFPLTNVIYIEELQAIVVLNYNYGTQFSTPLGSELNNMKRALYSAVINP